MLYNKERTNEYLKEYDLEAVVATTTFNVAYFTDFDCWQYRDFRENMGTPGASNSLMQAYAVVAQDKAPVLIAGTGSAQFANELSGIELRTYGGQGAKVPGRKAGEDRAFTIQRDAIASAKPTPQEALVGALEELGVKKGRIGIEFSNLSKASKKHAEKNLKKVEWLDATEFLRLIRMIKTPEELARMKKAAEITEKGLWKSFGAARAGATAGELYQTYLSEVASHGAVPDHYIYTAKGMGISSSPHYKFSDGEFQMIDCGVIYKQYYSDTGWTMVIEGNKEAEKMHHTLWEIFQSHIDLLSPGTKPSILLKAFGKSYKKAGLRGVNYQGHAVGLQTREHPVINFTKYKSIADDIVDIGVDIPLEEGMVINIETPMDVVGKGAYQVEMSFQIGKKKAIGLNPKREGVAYVTG
ncbi:MAG: M24 family metallopeptidase [Thaumarchaeota archaeon]|nr:M24 family metallopeptidase [Nitrososphaerota archaeon]